MSLPIEPINTASTSSDRKGKSVVSHSRKCTQIPKNARSFQHDGTFPSIAEVIMEKEPITPTTLEDTDIRASNGDNNDHSWVREPGETTEAMIERLGRERPKIFSSIWSEIGFVFSISMSQILAEYFLSGFIVIVPTLAKSLHIDQASATWPASAFSLTTASFLLIFGRLADMYGGYPLYVAGFAWLALWSLIAGFSNSGLMLNICRALQGLGPAAFLPASLMLLGCIYRPGPRKNIVFSIYGACAPIGYYCGIFFAGLTSEKISWPWFFYVGTLLSAITAFTAYLSVPSDTQQKREAADRPNMDWPGAMLSVSGLIMFTFAIIDSSHAPEKWATPYIYGLFILGSIFLISAGYVECYQAPEPLLPSSLFKVPSMPGLIVALFLTYGAYGIFLLYGTFYMGTIMGASPLQIAAWFTPMAVGGCLISTFSGFILHLLPGTILILIAGASWIVAPLLFAIAPEKATYWSYVFPSMICATIGVDITFSLTNIFITTSLPANQQGLAGSVIMILLHLGIAVMLGFADVINVYMEGRGMREAFKVVFWFEVACAGVALLVLMGFVKIKEAKSDLTVEEKRALESSGGEGDVALGVESAQRKEVEGGVEEKSGV
ncbi:hypothetical protein HYFRA_00001986 [Hymenoscyphus fraxineus]|uniref:Major facilitator superfamily (MFS) profile domain-containing protein n=1 Tax=Hymenoscyphus fraxineus TaxID=746836 RepID=A0A9N9PMM9_9HELO|nr:hypothetical protein HYFRA_00001986 [Hymenoscyphus fraxineus]